MQFVWILERILRKRQREKTLGFGVVSELLGLRHSESLFAASWKVNRAEDLS